MKKVIIACVVMIATVLAGNAQVFVGGGLGFDFEGGKSSYGGTSTDLPKTTTIGFMPKVGYYLNDDFAIGLEAGFFNSTEKKTSGSQDVKNSLTGWGVGAFARYNLVGTDKLSLLLEGAISVGGMKNKYTYGSTTSNGDPLTTFGIGVLPVISYSLTDRLSIEASCDFLRFGFQSVIIKDSEDSKDKETYNHFGLGVNTMGFNALHLDEYLELSSMVKIGVIFKF